VKHSRRGRPRLDRPRHDYGTPELVMKRMHIAPNNPIQATNPLDACLAKGIISDEAYNAACYFAAIRRNVFGKAIPPAIDLTAISIASVPTENSDASHEANYRDACAAMKGYSRKAFDAVENLVVHERWPSWLAYRNGPRVSEQAAFCLGMAALLGWLKSSRRKSA
jgi:hypothetical protein